MRLLLVVLIAGLSTSARGIGKYPEHSWDDLHELSREDFDESQKNTFQLARQVVERSYPPEDVATLRKFNRKYGDPCDVVAKDKCFYFAHQEDVDDEGKEKETIQRIIINTTEHSFLVHGWEQTGLWASRAASYPTVY